MKRYFLASLLLCTLAVFLNSCQTPPSPLQDRLIVIDPGHGGTADTDFYRVGPAGEREEWVNLRVALQLEEILTGKGARVILTRREDVRVPLKDRVDMAIEAGADLFLSIHHNATADPEVNFPIVYFHGNASANQASVELGRQVIRHLDSALFDGEGPVSLVSDLTIFPFSGSGVLRHCIAIPCVIAEASFFTNPEEEQRLKDPDYNRKEAQAFADALETWFASGGHEKPILPQESVGPIEPFAVFQEAERMRPEALEWHENFMRGVDLLEEDPQKAYELFSLSTRSFPDSPVAGEAHRYRAELLEKMGQTEQAEMERRRVAEFYVQVYP